jgi:hypothetical protein
VLASRDFGFAGLAVAEAGLEEPEEVWPYPVGVGMVAGLVADQLGLLDYFGVVDLGLVDYRFAYAYFTILLEVLQQFASAAVVCLLKVVF